ncbi:MAG: serpin family protein [Planctomycetota bacterium]
MRLPVLTLLYCVAFVLFLLGRHPSMAQEPQASPPPPDDAVAVEAAGLRRFAFELYGELRSRDGNLFVSPYSVSAALTLAYVGAAGKTEQEMATALHLGADRAAALQSRAAIHEPYRRRDLDRSQLVIANRFWGQSGVGWRPSFIEECQRYFDATHAHLDFAADSAACRDTINQWVSERTDAKIPQLIPEGILDASTRLVITNAICFKGTWITRFESANTQDGPFHVRPDQTVDVPLMRSKSRFPHARGDGWQLLGLPYAGDRFSMVILLPDSVDGLAELEAKLSADQAAAWTALLEPTSVAIVLPRFRLRTRVELAPVLAKLGMESTFTTRADFSRMTEGEPLAISNVIHEAFVEVNEEGTEAAAATGVVLKRAAPRPNPRFVADHPFLFWIHDRATNCILFLGRVVDPRG